MVFKNVCIIVLWKRVALALEGLKKNYITFYQISSHVCKEVTFSYMGVSNTPINVFDDFYLCENYILSCLNYHVVV